ncbi:MAG: hypothetical protein LBV47_04640, partial [Bacteroidales bacterium]|nr:hypothetical protein [Bacteroidales bacterium]
MVKAITFILIFQGLIIVPIMAQHNCNDSVMFGSPEELPVFNKELPCIEKLLEFIAKNIKYP